MSGMEFTMANIASAAEIMRAAESKVHVKWMPGDDSAIVEGMVRCIGDENGNFGGAGTKPFDELYVRITSTSGFEYFMPTTGVMDMMRAGLLYFGK